MGNQLLSRSDVAERLGVSLQTITRMLKRGELRGRRVSNGTLRFTKDDYQAYLRTLEPVAAARPVKTAVVKESVS